MVTVVDTVPPTLTCATNKTVPCGTPWTFDPPIATDNCCTNPVLEIVGTVTNGSPCDFTISRTWVAIDCCQNRSLPCTQTVRVVDHLASEARLPDQHDRGYVPNQRRRHVVGLLQRTIATPTSL
jgi:hypothetical protein